MGGKPALGVPLHAIFSRGGDHQILSDGGSGNRLNSGRRPLAARLGGGIAVTGPTTGSSAPYSQRSKAAGGFYGDTVRCGEPGAACGDLTADGGVGHLGQLRRLGHRQDDGVVLSLATLTKTHDSSLRGSGRAATFTS